MTGRGQARTAPPEVPGRAVRWPGRARWVLPEDGIVDELAVQIAAAGTRPVALTRTERRLAAARILAAGGTAYLVSKRLHLNGQTALALAAPLTSTQAPGRDQAPRARAPMAAGGDARSPIEKVPA